MSKSIQDIKRQIDEPRYAPRTQPKAIPTAAWNDEPLFCLQVNDEWVSHILGALNVLDQEDIWTGTDEEIWAARQQVNEIMAALMTQCPDNLYSFWDEPVPDTIDSDDTGAVALGIKFHTSVFGNILGIRFYKSEANTGEHVAHLWSYPDYDDLGSFTFADETSSGWQVGYFDTPIAIEACKEYVASYHAPNGHYSYSRPFFDVEFVQAPLYAPIGTFESGNGVYDYGDNTTAPNTMYLQSNYWIDVIFKPTGVDYLG